jgi:pyruvate/2-oxoglutarate dehydrogenase complex dihydrolipoamide acyltransferase (E2) component
MDSERLSTVRKALMWWLDWPGNPYVCVNCAIDFAPALGYLRAANEGRAPSVTVQHLLAATVARVLREFPAANARIIGSRIRRLERVDIAMPVSLRHHAAGDRHDLSMAVVERVDALSLRALAEACSHTIREERAGRPQHAVVRALTQLLEATPYPVVARGLDLFDWLVRRPLLAERFYRYFNVSTALTNPGAAFGRIEGTLFRGASMALPQRLFHVGTVWGVSAVQNEVIAVDGEPKVRPVLPLVLVFDHRLFDGIMAGEMLVRFAEILRDPGAVYGSDAEGRPSWEGNPEAAATGSQVTR